MSSISRRLYLVLAVSALLVGCGGDETPTVKILDASPKSIDPAIDASDDLTIKLQYTDPDGDLGGGVAEVHDCRTDAVVTRFDVPPIASKEAVDQGVEISGDLTLVVADVGEVEPGAKPAVCEGAASFCVVLIDTAGNKSDPACTGAIKIATPAP